MKKGQTTRQFLLLCAVTMLLLAGLCLPLLLQAEGAPADDASKKDMSRMDEIVVTATRTEKDVEDAPGSINVITGKEMKQRAIQSVDEALNTTAGVVSSRSKGPMDTIAGVTLRGIPDSGRTLVLVDGLTANDAYASTVDFAAMATEDLGRVEVVKGPFSSLYGGNAMGGVINIITRMPEKREFTVKSGYGSAWNRAANGAPKDYRTFYTSYGDKMGKLRLLASYDYRATNGYAANQLVTSSKPTTGITGWSYTTSNTGAARYLIGDKGDNEWRNDNIRLKGSYDLSPQSRINLSFLRTTGEYSYSHPNTYLRNASGKEIWSYGASVTEKSFLANVYGSERNTYNIGFETELSKAKIKTSFGYTDQAAIWYTTPGTGATASGGTGTISSYPSSSYNADLQVTVPLFERQTVTFGGAFKAGSIDRKDYNLQNWLHEGSKTNQTYKATGKDRNYALFFEDEITLHDKLTAYAGLRADWWETYAGSAAQFGTGGFSKTYNDRSESSFSPKVALVYKPFNLTTLRTSAGQAFRSPNLYSLYVTTMMGGSTQYASNPDLKPEKVTSWDIGIDQKLWKGARIKATYFENYIKDMIYSKNVTPTLVAKVNAGRGENKGIELEAEQKFDMGLRFFANFTCLDSKITENSASPSSVGKQFTYVPNRMFNVGGDFEKGPFGINITGRYMSKRYGLDDNSDTVSGVYGSYDPFFTIDTTVRYKVTSWASVSFSVNNIFGERYYVSSSLAPGRSYFAGVTLKF